MSEKQTKEATPAYQVVHVTFSRGVWFPDQNQSTLSAWIRAENRDVTVTVHGGGSVTLLGPRGRVTVPAAHVLAIREEVVPA